MTDRKTPSLADKLVSILKILVVAGALAYLVGSGRLNLGVLKTIPWSAAGVIALGVSALLVTIFLSFVRYFFLLRALSISLPFSTVLRIGAIGVFFNTFMFGSLGGDVVKLAYIIRETDTRAPAVASIMVDRVLGLLGLLTFGGLALFVSWNEVLATPSLHTLTLFVFGILGTACLSALGCGLALAKGRRIALAAWLALGTALFGFSLVAAQGDPMALTGDATPAALLRGRALVVMGIALAAMLLGIFIVPSLQPGRRLATILHDRVPGGRAVLKLVNSILIYRNHFRTLAGAYLLSVFLQGIALSSIYAFSQAVPLDPQPTVAHVFFAAPPALVMNAMPVPGGGLGVGETAFDTLLGMCRGPGGMPVDGGAEIFLVFRFWLIAAGLGGLPFYLMGRKSLGQTEEAEEAMEADFPADATPDAAPSPRE